jgi:hypothetical protein
LTIGCTGSYNPWYTEGGIAVSVVFVGSNVTNNTAPSSGFALCFYEAASFDFSFTAIVSNRGSDFCIQTPSVSSSSSNVRCLTFRSNDGFDSSLSRILSMTSTVVIADSVLVNNTNMGAGVVTGSPSWSCTFTNCYFDTFSFVWSGVSVVTSGCSLNSAAGVVVPTCATRTRSFAKSPSPTPFALPTAPFIVTGGSAYRASSSFSFSAASGLLSAATPAGGNFSRSIATTSGAFSLSPIFAPSAPFAAADAGGSPAGLIAGVSVGVISILSVACVIWALLRRRGPPPKDALTTSLAPPEPETVIDPHADVTCLPVFPTSLGPDALSSPKPHGVASPEFWDFSDDA